jgi:hypothetical protein
MTYKPGTIILHSRRYISPVALRVEDIDIQDICHALSNICRYGGHCPKFYSVAQHSVEVANWLADGGFDLKTQLWGLLHDASEAYMPDVASPLKKEEAFFPLWKLEDEIQYIIRQHFFRDQQAADWAAVGEADRDILSSECISLWSCQPIDWGLPLPKHYRPVHPLKPADARLLFEDRFHQLQAAIEGEKA